MDKMYAMEISSNPDDLSLDPLFHSRMQNPALNDTRPCPKPRTMEEWIEFIDNHPKFKELDEFIERLFPQGQTERIELYGRDVSRTYP